MNPRTLTIMLGIAVALLIALLVAAMFAPGIEQFRSAVIAVAGVIALICVAVMVWLPRRVAAERSWQEERESQAFERQMLAEMGISNVPPSTSASTAESEAVTPPVEFGETSPPVEAPTAQAGPKADAKPMGFEPLLAQLRLAKLDPRGEGSIHAGLHAGAVILRLAGGEVALATRHLPAADEWNELFPRYDRVFLAMPKRDGGEEKWVCVERLEGLVRARLDLSL